MTTSFPWRPVGLCIIALAMLMPVACGGGTSQSTVAAVPTTPAEPSVQRSSGPVATPQPATAACLRTADAAASLGKRVTVCGPVSGASHQSRSRGQPTFINFDKPFPNHTFVAVIWNDDRPKFNPAPELQFG